MKETRLIKKIRSIIIFFVGLIVSAIAFVYGERLLYTVGFIIACIGVIIGLFDVIYFIYEYGKNKGKLEALEKTNR